MYELGFVGVDIRGGSGNFQITFNSFEHVHIQGEGKTRTEAALDTIISPEDLDLYRMPR